MDKTRTTPTIGKEAVVIGASVGGILAARALANAFERVTIIERDEFPEHGEQRKGVPQGRHTHGLLSSGLEIMEDFFPGLKDDLVAQGALHGSVTGWVRWNFGPGYHAQYDSELMGIVVTRPRLEAQLRRRLLELPNVRAFSACDVLGLAASGDNRRVTGVRVIARRDGSVEEVLPADLVVDATGRGSRSPAWLEGLGYQRPAEDQVRVNLTYMSRMYRRDPLALDGDRGVIIASTKTNRRAGVMLAQEGDRWIVSLASYMGDSAPTDDEGYLAFARTLNAPEIYETLKNAEPLGPVSQHKIPSSQRRRYERLERFPEGYLVFGDALCSFNPIYGQGMSVSAQEARALDEILREGGANLWQRFIKRAAVIIEIPWTIAAGNDLRYPEVEGPRSKQTDFINWYVEQLHEVAQFDKTASLAFQKVTNLMAPPASLMHPRIALRVLLGRLFPRRVRPERQAQHAPAA